MIRFIAALLLVLAGASFIPDPARADAFHQADLMSASIGYFDFDKTDSDKQSVDMRAEYRWGLSLLPKIDKSFNTVEPFLQVHPMVGVEITSLGALYAVGGYAMDVPLGKHVIFTWSEGLGLFEPGAMKPLGSVLEFRSMGELGWRFSNQMRVTLEASHISNAKITFRNPGAEIAGVYLHIPVNVTSAR